MLVRTWNLNSGNALPPDRRSHVREMVELITTGGPDIVCLQELPAWALGAVETWTTMRVFSSRATRPKAGFVPVGATLGHQLSRPHSGRLTERFAGSGNTILIPREMTVRSAKTITLNTNVFCEERGAELGLDEKQVRRWERRRRICQLVQFERADRRRFLVATLHATSYPADLRLAEAELKRAINFIERRSEVEEIVIVAGDFNISRAESATIQALESAPPESRWDDQGAHVDHVLIRGATAASTRVWAREERIVGGRLLSDHYPIEVELPVAEWVHATE